MYVDIFRLFCAEFELFLLNISYGGDKLISQPEPCMPAASDDIGTIWYEHFCHRSRALLSNIVLELIENNDVRFVEITKKMSKIDVLIPCNWRYCISNRCGMRCMADRIISLISIEIEDTQLHGPRNR